MTRRNGGKSALELVKEILGVAKDISPLKILGVAVVVVGSLWTFTGARDTLTETASQAELNREAIQSLDDDVRDLNSEVSTVRNNVRGIYGDIERAVENEIVKGVRKAVASVTRDVNRNRR